MSKPDTVMPRPINAMTVASPMMDVIKDRNKDYDGLFGRDDSYEWLGRWCLPKFQRPPVWTTEQNVRFLESAWLGYDIGRYTVMNPTRLGVWTDVLIDGQQRIRALRSYTRDEFPVFGHLYSEITEIDRRHFQIGIGFPRVEIRENLNEEMIRDIYNRLNYGGTSHTEDQRA